MVADHSKEDAIAWAWAEHFHEQRIFELMSLSLGGKLRRELAHELRNRLTPMLTLAHILKKADKLDPATLAWAGQSMEKQILGLSGLANSLQNAGTVPGDGPPPTPVDLRQIASQAMESLRPLLSRHRLSLPSHAAWILGDPACLLHPVSLCLLKTARQTNALDIATHTEAGQAALTISGHRSDSLARDNSPPAWTPPSGEDAGHPLGMGIRLAKTLIEQQGGSLVCHGTEAGNPWQAITLRLPLAGSTAFPPTQTLP